MTDVLDCLLCLAALFYHRHSTGGGGGGGGRGGCSTRDDDVAHNARVYTCTRSDTVIISSEGEGVTKKYIFCS